MGKKFTYDEVEKTFTDGGCKLLSKSYKDVFGKLDYICKCGNKSEISYKSFKNGRRCRECRYKKAAITLRNKCNFNIEYVRQYFLDQGCELLESEYTNARTRMKYRCVCGNESQIVFDSFKKGNRCKKCGYEKISNKMVQIKSGDKNPNWRPDREELRLEQLFAEKCRNMIKNVIRNLKELKREKTKKLLGYSFNELRKHIENHPNYGLVKLENWQLDHIFPIKAFLDYGIKDIKLINSLDNLQPLTVLQNQSKHAKYNCKDFEIWLKSKNYKKGGLQT